MAPKEKSKQKAKPRGNAAVTGTVTRIWHNDGKRDSANTITANGGVGRVKTQHVEIATGTGRRILIQLRSLTHTYMLRETDKIRVRIPNLIQIYQFPNLTDEVLSATAAKFGGIVYPEKSSANNVQQPAGEPHDTPVSNKPTEPVLEIITKYNAVLPESIMQRYADLEQGKRRQVTLKLLGERVDLMPQSEHLMYLSAVLTDVRLVEMWQKQQLYCMPCETCGEVIFGNQLVGACPRKECGKVTELRVNPQVIAGLTDETGTLGKDHNLLVMDGIWEKLLAGGNSIGDGTLLSEEWIREREQLMMYERFTWVLMWMGKWGGGRLVAVDLLE